MQCPFELKQWWKHVQRCMVKGADLSTRDANEQTLLHWAITVGDAFFVTTLLKAGLDRNVKAKRRGPNTPGISPLNMAEGMQADGPIRMVIVHWEQIHHLVQLIITPLIGIVHWEYRDYLVPLRVLK